MQKIEKEVLVMGIDAIICNNMQYDAIGGQGDFTNPSDFP